MPRLCIAEREHYAEDIRAQVEDIPMEEMVQEHLSNKALLHKPLCSIRN